ncbi:HrpB1 family type III secretion system apparatus protein [Xanthomonas theicola]|uniref:HrpB1 family type III secretion system apparatus protein n=1 Tax=Xanthomonas theicola TaxID=56464 RepID=UPI001FE6CDC6|nr:HrpB1 family type III secretion system apparatus protein [Xanthomonas theicola]
MPAQAAPLRGRVVDFARPVTRRDAAALACTPEKSSQGITTMHAFQAKDELTNGLIEIITVGMQKNCLAEAETLLAALRVLRPNLTALDNFDAWLAIKRGRFTDAARMLRSLDGTPGAPAMSKALRACCLFAIGDSEWTVSANEVISENADPDAVALVKMLSGQSAEPRQAAADGTGAGAADAGGHSGATADLATFGYLRG